MPIQQVWLTSKGTQCATEKEAVELEQSELIEVVINSCHFYGDYDNSEFISFLRNDVKAKEFVDAVNFFYNQNKTEAS
jgi:hypothetical protein